MIRFIERNRDNFKEPKSSPWFVQSKIPKINNIEPQLTDDLTLKVFDVIPKFLFSKECMELSLSNASNSLIFLCGN